MSGYEGNTTKGGKDDPDQVLHLSGWDYLQKPHVSAFNYAVTGHESQIVTIQLVSTDSNDDSNKCKAEPGTMMYLSDGISQGIACEGCFARCLSGEACWVSTFTYSGTNSNNGVVALTPNFPTSKVVPVDLSSTNVNGVLIAQSSAFMAVAKAPKRITDALDARIAETKRTLDEAKALRAEAEALLAEAKAKAAASAGDAQSIVTHAEAEAKHLIEDAKAKATDLTERRRRMAEDKIGAAERAAVDQVRARAATVAAAIATEVLRQSHDAKADAASVDAAINDLQRA